MKKRQEVYDLYWYFACERQNIFWKKINGESAPWTEDKILQEYKFCNSYRVNDRVSQYLLKNVIYNGKKYSNEDMLFRILLFKLFNKESTWELLLNNFSDITLKTFDVKAYEEDQTIMIALETGSIEVNASNYESFRMEPGDKALYDKSSRRFEIHRSSDVTKYSTWREDRLVFRSEPLREVLNTISRNYNIEFEVKDTSILDYSYTITIDTTDWRIALKELEKITPIQFKEKVDKIEVYKRD